MGLFLRSRTPTTADWNLTPQSAKSQTPINQDEEEDGDTSVTKDEWNVNPAYVDKKTGSPPTEHSGSRLKFLT